MLDLALNAIDDANDSLVTPEMRYLRGNVDAKINLSQFIIEDSIFDRQQTTPEESADK